MEVSAWRRDSGGATIIAIEDGSALNWSEAAVLAGYLKNGKDKVPAIGHPRPRLRILLKCRRRSDAVSGALLPQP